MLSFNNLNSVQLSVDDLLLTFLIDTGASLSAVKNESIHHMRKFFHPKTTYINGVGGQIISEGYVELNVQRSNLLFQHNFHILK